jgi:beta-lactamase regulating signal transducer with metallopeptidase domain
MLWLLTQHLLVTAGLACVVALSCRIGRLSPAVRHALWLIVLVKLLVPPLFELPWPEISQQPVATPTPLFPPSTPLPAAKARPNPPPALVRNEAPAGSPILSPPAAKEPGPEAPSISMPSGTSLQPGFMLETSGGPGAATASVVPWTEIGLSVWVAGALLAAALHLVRILGFQRQLRTSQAAARWLKRLVRDLAGKFAVQPPRTVTVPALKSPMLWCVGRPVLLWPASLIEPVEPHRWRGVVAHELAHLKRRDHWVGWLLLVAECLWWWNPLFWLVRRQLRLHAELACDAWVVWALPDDRRPYAEALLEVTEHVAATLPTPVLGIGSSAGHALQRRLTMIMCESTPCRVPVRGLLIAGLLALLLVPAWTLGDDHSKNKKSDKSPAAEAALKKALADLEDKKKQLETEVDQLKKQLAEMQNAKTADQAERDALEKSALGLRLRLTDLQNQYATLVVDPSASFADVTKFLIGEAGQNRNWGPEQATGAPNVPQAGDDSQAWASLTEDGQDEWLCLEYAEAVTPLALMVYESCNPGALWKVSIFTEDDRELELWKGKDPVAPGSGSGVALIQLKVDFRDLKTKKVKLYFKSMEVKGWNEIDAVGLLDAAGRLQWATAATASSSYAEHQSRNNLGAGWLLTDATGRVNINQEWLKLTEGQRLQQLENDLRLLRNTVDRLATGRTVSKDLDRAATKPLASRDADDPIQRLTKENKELRDQMSKFEQMLIDITKRLESKP